MIPDSLLIQVEPIRWIGGFSWNSLLIGLISSIIIVSVWVILGRWMRQSRRMKILSELFGEIPQSDDPQFESRSAEMIRRLLQFLYVPHSSQAHTAQELTKYVEDRVLIDALTRLEEAEYQEKKLSEDARIDILTLIEGLKDRVIQSGKGREIKK